LPPLPPIHDELLQRAVFTHSGVAEGAVTNSSAEVNYDRLEILGDAYLELLATRLIWDHFKGLPPGRISQIREDLVKNETLAGYATLYGFDTRAVVPKDYPSQAKRWTKTKADIFEAYVAAAILSDPKNGYQAVQSWLWQLWAPRISQVGDVPQALVNKETLAKKIMSKGIKVKYADIEPLKNLKGGTQTFTVGVFLTGWGWTNHLLGSGKGSNRAIAGDLAAKHALDNKPLIDQIAQLKQAHDLENKKAV
jgi:ribonuclease III